MQCAANQLLSRAVILSGFTQRPHSSECSRLDLPLVPIKATKQFVMRRVSLCNALLLRDLLTRSRKSKCRHARFCIVSNQFRDGFVVSFSTCTLLIPTTQTGQKSLPNTGKESIHLMSPPDRLHFPHVMWMFSSATLVPHQTHIPQSRLGPRAQRLKGSSSKRLCG